MSKIVVGCRQGYVKQPEPRRWAAITREDLDALILAAGFSREQPREGLCWRYSDDDEAP